MQRGTRQAEMLLGLLEYVLLSSAPQRGAPNLFRLAQGNRSRRIELVRLRPIEPGEQVDDVVESTCHVHGHFLLSEVPPAFLFYEMEDPLPGLGIGHVDHS